jgi:hypothetical protein
MRISGIPKREEGISLRWKMSFQNSGKLGQDECNNIQFTTV